jgi:hypothetical protein
MLGRLSPPRLGQASAGGGGGLEAIAGLEQPGVIRPPRSRSFEPPAGSSTRRYQGSTAGDVAFQLNAVAAAASYGFQLRRDLGVFARARRSMRAVLRVRPST